MVEPSKIIGFRVWVWVWGLGFLVVEPSEIIFLITIPPKEDIILLYIGYHNIPNLNTTHLEIPLIPQTSRFGARVWALEFTG